MDEQVKAQTSKSFLSLAEVVDRTSLSSTTIWREENAGRFPKRRKLSLSRVGFVENEIDSWCESKVTSN